MIGAAGAPATAPGEGSRSAGAAPPRSGAGLGLVRIELDGPAHRSTRKPSETITGSIVSGPNVDARIEVNDTTLPIVVEDGRFKIDVPLKEGLNQVRVIATDPQRGTAAANVAIEYAPPPVPGGIAIVSPADGVRLGPDDPPVVIVRGRVEDPATSSVTVVMNQFRFEVPVRQGTFEAFVPIVEPVVRLTAEARPASAPVRRSAGVTVHAAPGAPTTAVLFVDWSGAAPGDDRVLRAAWRGRPDRLEGPSGPVGVQRFPLPPETRRSIYYVRPVRPGAFTFVLDGAKGDVPTGAVLFIPVAGATAMRPVKPPRAAAITGRVTIARLLMPFGVLWDDDEWVMGRSDGPDTITKFNAEGVSWIERRGELR